MKPPKEKNQVEKNKQLININHYLATLKKRKITPNFWTSAEYLLKSNAVYIEFESVFGFIANEEDDGWLLPPMGERKNPTASVFAGWPDVVADDTTFLDYQFIYKPKDFQNMSGSKWKVFRKNTRKFPRRFNGTLTYRRIKTDEIVPELSILLTSWAENREVFDPDTFVRFILHGDNRKGLFVNNCLVGVNVWDVNYYYINFRYCVDDGSPFLNEYMRYLFYTDNEILQQNKLVNDGGSLGSELLRKFKLKLNPHQILKIYSHKEVK